MKTLGKTNMLSRVMAVLMAVLLVFGSFQPVQAAGPETIAEWSFTEAPTMTDGVIGASTGSGGLSLTGGPVYKDFSSSSICATKWDGGGAWEISNINATNYENLTFSAKIRSTGTGPRDFQLQYSTDGVSWTPIAGTDVVATKTLALKFKNVSLPAELAGKTFSLRVAMVGTTSVGEGTVAAGGNSNINNITISGTKTAGAVETCEAVTFSPAAGEVEKGTAVTISCGTAGATIYYKLNDAAEYSEYTAATTITVNDVTTVMAYSAKEGMQDSSPVTAAYTVKATVVPPEPTTQSEFGPKLTSLKDGDTFVIFNPEKSKVMTSNEVNTTKGVVLGPVDGTVTDGKLTASNESAVLTAKLDTATNFWTFTCNGEYLTSGATGNSVTLEAAASEYSLWVLEKADEDGGFFIKNANAKYGTSEQYLEFYSNFTTFGKKSTAAPGPYLMHFYSATTDVPPAAEVGTQITELADEDVFIVFNPDKSKVMTSLEKTTSKGVVLEPVDGTVSDGKLTAPKNSAVLIGKLDPKTNFWTFTCKGEYLTSGAAGNSLTLEAAPSDYSLWVLEKADDKGGYFVKNANAKYGTSEQYLEFYSNFTTFGKKSTAAPGPYLMHFYRAVEEPAGTTVETADLVMNIAQWAGNANYETAGVTASSGILGDIYRANDMKDTEALYTAIVSGKQVKPYTGTSYLGGTGLGSGNDDYLQFAFSSKGWAEMDMEFRARVSGTGAGSWQLQYSTDGNNFSNFSTGTYIYGSKEGTISNGIAKTGMSPTNYISFKFDVPEGADNADNLYIRLVPGKEQANDPSKPPTTSGTMRVDSVIVSGKPILAADICGFVEAKPDGSAEVPIGSTVTLTSSTKGAEIFYSLNGEEYVKYDENAKVVLKDLPATIRAYATKTGMSDSVKTLYRYMAGQVKPVKATPNGGAVKKGTELTLTCDTEDAVILYSTDNGETWKEYKGPITLNNFPATYKVKAQREGYQESTVTTLNFTERTSDKFGIFFGQLHSHTNYSDGAGSCEDAFKHASNTENLDFVAVTDHSNSFDNADKASITDGSMSTEWVEGHKLAEKYTTDKFVALFGYEMTWSNGLGHMNTFNSDGFQSRTQSDYSTYSTALQNYYAALKKDTDSISQFNHPGSTFGDFNDFSHYDEELDNLITLVEVGNGEGAVGSSGYFPSYEYYQRALDKGWHVAPSNNQDNHKGLWGDANTARSVVLADSLTEANIYDAMRNYRVYATEDNDLSIYYTLNGYEMGSILSDAGDTVNIKAELSDPTDNSVGKVQVITNGGLVLAEKTLTKSNETVEFKLDNNYSYYYLKIVETDGDIAVTAPVWVGEVEAAGIQNFSTDEALPVKGEPIKVDLSLYNNEDTDMTVDSIEFSVGDEVVHTVDLAAASLTTVKSLGTGDYSFDYTYDKVGSMELNVTVNATLNGAPKQYKSALKLTYVTPEMVTKVIIDGTHYNDYVSGYYSGNMGNFTKIAAEKNIKVQVVKDKITAETLKDCALLVVSAPARKNGTTDYGDYKQSFFEDEFIQTVKDYVDNGGSVITCGLADYQDKSQSDKEKHVAAQINKLLAAVGSSMTINDDEAYDAVNNGGQLYRLYPETFNMDSQWTEGIVTKNDDPEKYQKYSQYSGCTVNPGDGKWLVRGFDTTYSVDSDKDGVGSTSEIETDDDYKYNIVVPKGEAVFLATEETGKGGHLFAAGGVFISDFEVKAELDNIWDLPYANRTIAENILDAVTVELPRTDIAVVRKAQKGEVFRIEGYVTAGRENPNNAFFDAICVQDETGGITVFPYSVDGLELGTKMSITGYVDEYQGEIEIQVLSAKILEDEPKNVIEPEKLSAKDAMNYEENGGKLVSVKGKVVKIEDAGTNGEKSVNKFYLDDGSGTLANIFIDGYIKSGTTGENTLADIVKEGSWVSAVGLIYAHPEGQSDEPVICLRVRNTDEVTAEESPEPGTVTSQVDTGEGAPEVTVDSTPEEIKDAAFTDEEKTAIEDGTSAKLIVKISALDSDAMDADVVQKAENAAKGLGNDPKLNYYDISVYKQLDGGELQQVHDLNTPGLKLTITIPDTIKKDGRIYGIVRVHNGEAELIPSTTSQDGNSITFTSDKFSTYGLAYADKETGTEDPGTENPETEKPGTTKPEEEKPSGGSPQTGDNSRVYEYSIMLTMAGASVVILLKRRKKYDLR